MGTTFTFQQKEIDNAINMASTVNFKPEQKIIIDNFAKILNSFVSINELALKGFINNVIIEWQKETGEFVGSISVWPPEKRIESVSTMFNKLKDVLIKILKYRNESEKLEAAVNKALDFYKKEFAYR